MNENHWYVTPLQGDAPLYLGLLEQEPRRDWPRAGMPDCEGLARIAAGASKWNNGRLRDRALANVF